VQTLRKRHIGVPLLGLILLAGVGFIVLSQSPPRLPHASTEPDPMASDRPAIADFSVQSTEGDTFKLSSHKGKVVLVSFWSSECSTCVLELPAFSELSKRYKSDGLEILSINLDPPETATKTTQDVWARGNFAFKPYVDPSRAVAKTFQIETVPSGFVIDRQGRIAFNSYGANDWLAPETARLIEDLLLEE
jgi:peroxiredoxin